MESICFDCCCSLFRFVFSDEPVEAFGQIARTNDFVVVFRVMGADIHSDPHVRIDQKNLRICCTSTVGLTRDSVLWCSVLLC